MDREIIENAKNSKWTLGGLIAFILMSGSGITIGSFSLGQERQENDCTQEVQTLQESLDQCLNTQGTLLGALQECES